MPISFGDQLQVKVFQEMQGQQILNVMHYDVIGGTPPLSDPQIADLAYGFGSNWWSKLRPRQTTALSYTRVEIEVLNTPWFGSYTFPGGAVGLSAGDPLPIFNATSIQKVRSNKVTRHGYVRIAGMTEVDNQAGVISADWRTMINGWADFFIRPQAGAAVLDMPLYDEEGAEYDTLGLRCIIWGGNDPGFPLGRWQYVSAYDVNERITTQNTRKIGRGS